MTAHNTWSSVTASSITK